MTYDDPRLAVVYDVDNPDGPDHDFFRALADRVGATSINDLGCGTGILTVTLATDGRQVTGIDPAPAMLERAKGRTGGDQVTWLQGTSAQIRPSSADLVIMSGNVAMHITGPTGGPPWTTSRRGFAPAGCSSSRAATRRPARACNGTTHRTKEPLP